VKRRACILRLCCYCCYVLLLLFDVVSALVNFVVSQCTTVSCFSARGAMLFFCFVILNVVRYSLARRLVAREIGKKWEFFLLTTQHGRVEGRGCPPSTWYGRVQEEGVPPFFYSARLSRGGRGVPPYYTRHDRVEEEGVPSSSTRHDQVGEEGVPPVFYSARSSRRGGGAPLLLLGTTEQERRGCPPLLGTVE